MNYYGLRRARVIVREAAHVVKGETDSYAKGWRDALREVYKALSNEMHQEKSESTK